MIQVENLAEVMMGIDQWVEAVEDLADTTFRGLTAKAFRYILEGTPEWTGDLVASWRITIGAPASGYTPTIFKEAELGGLVINPEPFSRVTPNHAAVQYALSIAKGQLAFVTLGTEVYISNPSPYAQQVEDNQKASGNSFIRPVNLVNGRVEMVHAAADKFNALGELSEIDAHALSAEKM